MEGINEEYKCEIIDGVMKLHLTHRNSLNSGFILHYEIASGKRSTDLLDPSGTERINTYPLIISTEMKSKAIFITDDYLDASVIHPMGIDYIITGNGYLSKYNYSVVGTYETCIVTNAELIDKDLVDVHTVVLDFSQLVESQDKISLFDLAVKIQENDANEDGIAKINKYLSELQSGSTNNDSYSEAVKAPENISPSIAESANRDKDSEEAVSQIHEEHPKFEYTTIELPLSSLYINEKFQPRFSKNAEHVSELVVSFKNNEDIPPIIVVDVIGTGYIVIDGHHRVDAAKQAGLDNLPCLVTKGSTQDAFELSLGANESNKALQRTKADKRKAVMSAFEDLRMKEYSNRKIAEICMVSSSFVDNIKNELLAKKSVKKETTPLASNKVQNSSAISNNIKNAHVGTDDDRSSCPYQKENEISTQHIMMSITVKELIDNDSYETFMEDIKLAALRYDDTVNDRNAVKQNN